MDSRRPCLDHRGSFLERSLGRIKLKFIILLVYLGLPSDEDGERLRTGLAAFGQSRIKLATDYRHFEDVVDRVTQLALGGRRCSGPHCALSITTFRDLAVHVIDRFLDEQAL